MQLALNDDRAVNGMTIFVEEGTYEYSSAPIVVDKSLTICGASRTGTILSRTDYVVALLIRAPNVSVVDMTVSQGPGGRILSSLEYEATIQVGGLTRIDVFC